MCRSAFDIGKLGVVKMRTFMDKAFLGKSAHPCHDADDIGSGLPLREKELE